MATSAISVQRYFARLRDPRINRRKRHLLIDIIVITLCAVIACDHWEDIAIFARLRLAWLQPFLALPNGTLPTTPWTVSRPA